MFVPPLLTTRWNLSKNDTITWWVKDVNETLVYETETRPRHSVFGPGRDRDQDLTRPRTRHFSRPSKLNTDAHTNSPILRHQNRFCGPTHSWRNWVHNLWCSTAWWTDRQTDKNSTFLSALAAPDIRAPPNSAWWLRMSTTLLRLYNFWGSDVVSPLGSAENLGVTQLPQLKTPRTP